jgi:hypothetical protein
MFPNTSESQNRIIFQPFSSTHFCRRMSYASFPACESPSNSKITFLSQQQKSTINGPMGCCLRNFKCTYRRSRNSAHNSSSLGVIFLRRRLARFFRITGTSRILNALDLGHVLPHPGLRSRCVSALSRGERATATACFARFYLRFSFRLASFSGAGVLHFFRIVGTSRIFECL